MSVMKDEMRITQPLPVDMCKSPALYVHIQHLLVRINILLNLVQGCYSQTLFTALVRTLKSRVLPVFLVKPQRNCHDVMRVSCVCCSFPGEDRTSVTVVISDL